MIHTPPAASLSDLSMPRWLALLRTHLDPLLLFGRRRSSMIADATIELAQIEVCDVDLPFTQLTVGGRDPERGTTACCEISANWLAMVLLQQNFTDFLKAENISAMCAKIVAQWDDSKKSAPEPKTYLPHRLRLLLGENIRCYDVLIVGDREQLVYSLSRLLCREALPFGVAVTVQTARVDGEVKAFDVHKTFTIAGADNVLVCFESHVGRLICVRDTSLRGAIELVRLIVYGTSSRSGLLSQMGVASDQVEVVVFDLRGISASECDLAHNVLVCRSTCDSNYLNAFAQVGRRLALRWNCPLYQMGDVHMAARHSIYANVFNA